MMVTKQRKVVPQVPKRIHTCFADRSDTCFSMKILCDLFVSKKLSKMKYGQLVVGPAGSGKSTYCATLAKHGEAIGRRISVVNLDPAAEQFDYEPIADVRELLSVTDVMEELSLGPNGGLVFCMEYLIQNPEWLEEKLQDYEDEYIVFDCPGQIELYTHLDIMKKMLHLLTQRLDFRVCGLFLMDSLFAGDRSKFFSALLVSLSTLVNLEIPSLNVFTKLDLLEKKDRKLLDDLLEPQIEHLLEDKRVQEEQKSKKSFASLSIALAKLLDDYSLVKFFPLDIQDEESVSDLLLMIDNTIQYGEDADVKVRDFNEPEVPE